MSLHDEIVLDGFDYYWRFHDIDLGGFADDDGTNPISATIQGTPSSAAALSSGSLNSALFGTGDAIYATARVELKAQAFTWIMPVLLPGGAAANGSLLCLQPRGKYPDTDFAGGGASVRLAAGNLVFSVIDNANTPVRADADSGIDIRDAQPHLLGVTYDAADGPGGKARLYLDGVQVASVDKASVDWVDDGGFSGPTWGTVLVNGYHNRDLTGQAMDYAAVGMTVDFVAIKGGTALSATRMAEYWTASGMAPIVRPPVSARVYANFDGRERPQGRAYARVNIRQPISARCYTNVDTTRVRARVFATVNIRKQAGGRVYANVDTATDFSVAQRPGVRWRPRVLIDGIDQTHLTTGQLATEWEKGKAFIARFNLKPPDGSLEPADYDGRPVVFIYRDLDDNNVEQFALRRYAGTISGAIWRPDTGTLECKATTQHDQRFKFMATELIAREFGGEHSPYIFGTSARGWDYALDHMETLQADVWFRPDGGIMRAPWATEPPRLEWAGGDLFIESLRHRRAPRSRMLNRVSLQMDYRYERLRQRVMRCHWSAGIPFCEALINGMLHAQRSMIEGAARGNGGWQLVGPVTFGDMPPAKPYKCFPNASTSAQKYIVWKGDPEEALAWQAWWKIGRRWGQRVTERHAIEIVAQQSVDANGLIEAVENYSVASEKDNSAWLQAEGFGGVADDGFSLITGSGGTEGGVVLGDMVKAANDDAPGSRADFDQAQVTAIAAIEADMIARHREQTIARNLFDPRVKPGIKQRLNHPKIQTSGNVTAIREVFDLDAALATTEVTVEPFRYVGAGLATPDPIEASAAPEMPKEPPLADRLYFPTRIGGRTNSPHFNEAWTGYTTNWQTDPTNTDPFATDPTELGDRLYPNRFTVEYPEIPEQDLRSIEVPAVKRIAVAIPEDELVLTQ